MEETYVYPKEAFEFLTKYGTTPIQNKVSLAELLKRPEITYDVLSEIDKDQPNLSSHGKTQIEVQIKYEGYINKQLTQIEKFKKLEGKPLSSEIDYSKIEGLRIEAYQKLNTMKPVSVGQASRISGVSPADINVILIHLEKEKRKGK